MDDSDETIGRVLDHVGRDLDLSILIGGWATHLRVGGEISHDIDLIVTPSSSTSTGNCAPKSAGGAR